MAKATQKYTNRPTPSLRWWARRISQKGRTSNYNNNQEVITVRRIFSFIPAAILVVVLALLAVPGFASATPVAKAASSPSWNVLGGEPLFTGGLQGTGEQQRESLVNDLGSTRGQQAMQLADLSSPEIKAVDNDLQHGKFVSCQLVAGMVFVKMSYGTAPILVDSNVEYSPMYGSPHSAPAYCLTATAQVGDKVFVIHVLVPVKCVNFSVESITEHVIKKVVKKHKPRPKPKPKKLSGFRIRKACVTGTTPFVCPTNTFRFQVSVDGRKPKTYALASDPELFKGFKIGSMVTIKEIKPLGSDSWKTVSAVTQHHRITSRVYTFVYKDQELSPAAPATPAIQCTDKSANNYGSTKNQCQYNVVVTNPCQGYSVSGEYASGNMCAVNVCGTQIIITGNNDVVNVNSDNCSPSTPPTTPSPTITFQFPTFNEMNAGSTSNPQYVTYAASEAGGSFTISPSIGGISTCGGTEQSSVEFDNLPAGSGQVCIVLYAANDSDDPPSFTVTGTAVLGTDVVTQTSPNIGLSYPEVGRPS